MFAEITEATLQAIPGILDPGKDGYHDTAADDLAFARDLIQSPIGPPRSSATPGSSMKTRL